MNHIEQYIWTDSTVYLNHAIVRINDHYTVIGADPNSSYVIRLNTVEEAMQAIDTIHLSDLVMDLLLLARNRGLIDDFQREGIVELLDDEMQLGAVNLLKLVQKCLSFQDIKVS